MKRQLLLPNLHYAKMIEVCKSPYKYHEFA